MTNKFIIISPSFNNERWVKSHLDSIKNQTYTNYEVYYIDDASTDNTSNLVQEYIKDLPNFKYIRNEVNKGAAYNYVEYLESIIRPNAEDILVHLDGDDFLAYPTTLENLNDWYSKQDYWMTYGTFITYPGLQIGNPQNTPYSEFVQEYKLYRRDSWRASHLRTYKYHLFSKVLKEDLKSGLNTEYYWHASDLAWAFPCLEMCPKGKVGVIPEITYIYNTTESGRTKERESTDNRKFEEEIRNKKVYKTVEDKEKFPGKLPQVNVWSYDQEVNSVPKTFSYVYQQTDGEFDITLLNDEDILKYLSGEIKIKRGKIVADIHETPEYSNLQKKVYEEVKKNFHRFDQIISFHNQLEDLPNFKLRLPVYSVLNKNVHLKQWPLLGDPSLFQTYEKEKSKGISCISSNKAFLPGHKTRLEFVKMIQTHYPYVDLYGIGFNEIKGKIEGLQNYKYSIVIENARIDNWVTEKLFDCFLTGTIPIYYGAPNVGKYFNTNGILPFNSQEELDRVLRSLQTSPELYEVHKKAIEENFKKAKELWFDNDIFFSRYLKHLL